MPTNGPGAADSLARRDAQYIAFWSQQLGDKLPKFIEDVAAGRGIDPAYYADSGMRPEQLEALRQLMRRQAGLSTSAGAPWAVDTQKWLGTDAQAPIAQQRQLDLQAAQDAKNRGTINDQIQRFIDSMTGEMAPNDPVRLSLVQAGQDAAQGAAGRAGLGASGRSGLVGSSAASLAQRNIVPYEAQRAQWRAQGLGLLNNRDISLGQLALEKTKLDRQAEDATWAAQQNAQQGLGSAIGAGLAAIPGIALAGYTGGASMGLIPAGASFGGGIASLAGGGSGPNYSRPAPARAGSNPFTGY